MLGGAIAAAAIVALGVLLVGKFGEMIANLHDLVAGFVKILGMIIYMLSYIFFLIIDFLEITFKRVIGIKGTYEVTLDGAKVSSGDDLVLTIIKSKTISNIFLALSVIALFLLLISVIIAIIRSEYSWDKQGNSKGPIFGKALKAVALYLTVPVACMFGVWGASKLLKALDEATSGGKETFISSMIFASAAQSGNRLNSDALWEALREEVNATKTYDGKTKESGNIRQSPFAWRFARFSNLDTFKKALGDSNSSDVQQARAQVRADIDNAFKASYGTDVETIVQDESNLDVKTEGFSYGNDTWDPYKSSWTRDADGNESSTLWLIRNSAPSGGSVAHVCSPYSLSVVYFYYGLIPGAGGVGWGYNHVLSILVAFMILKVLFDITCGVLKRAYELVVLYVISPPVVALMPLDDGAAYKGWCKAFIGKTLMAYGGVLAINFFFMLVPIFSSIKIFTLSDGLTGAQKLFFGGGAIASFFDMLVQLLFIIAGAFSLSSLSKMISGIIGAEDAAESGGAISGAVGGMMGKVAGVTLGVATGGAAMIAKGAGAAFKKGKDGGKDGGSSSGGGSPSGGSPSMPSGSGPSSSGSAAASGSSTSVGMMGVAPPSAPAKSTKIQDFVKNPFKSTIGAAGKTADKAITGIGGKVRSTVLGAISEEQNFYNKTKMGNTKVGRLAGNIGYGAIKGAVKVGSGAVSLAYGGVKAAGKTMGRLFGAAIGQFGDGKIAETFNKTYGSISGADKIKKAEEKAQAKYEGEMQAANAQNMYAAANNSYGTLSNTSSIADIAHTTSVMNKHINSQGKTARKTAKNVSNFGADISEIKRTNTEMNKREKVKEFIAEQEKKAKAAEAARNANQERQKAARQARAKRNKK